MITESQVLSYYAQTFPSLQSPSVARLDLIPTGWESEVYALDLEHGHSQDRRREALILRLYPGKGASDKAREEFSGISVLHKAGYPVPQVFHLELDTAFLGHPFVIMERIDGPVLWDLMIHPDESIEPAWLDLFCKLFVRLHRLDWKPFVDDPDQLDPGDPYHFVDRTLSSYRYWDEKLPDLSFSSVLDWLVSKRDQMACPKASVVHLDFHPQNILVKQGNPPSPVVIDWTNLAISDPRFDLAWTLVLSYAYLGEAARKAILHGYEKAQGKAVKNIELFEVFACVRRLADIAASITLGAEKLGMRPGAEEIMKQQILPAQKVYELFQRYTGLHLPHLEEILAGG